MTARSRRDLLVATEADERTRRSEREATQRQKRAANIQWTVDETYTWTPHPALSDDDRALLLLNARDGALHRLYDLEAIHRFVAQQRDVVPQSELEALLALPMQGTADQWLEQERPALRSLIEASERAERLAFEARPPKEMNGLLRSGFLARKAGEVPKLSPRLRLLLGRLEALQGLSTQTLLDGMRGILSEFFAVRPRRHSRATDDASAPKQETRRERAPLEQPLLSEEELQDEMAVGSAEFTASVYLSRPQQMKQEAPKKVVKAKAEEARREIVERTYGASSISPATEEALAKKTSTGIHRDVRPLVTRGVLPLEASEYRRESRKKVQQANEQYLNEHRKDIARATEHLEKRLRAAIKRAAQDETVVADHGRLMAARAWRAVALHDTAIFQQVSHEAPGSLIVDVLLDASASQAERSAEIAAQGFILAKALASADIPFRALSYQSQQGFTILTLLKDYDEAPDAEVFMRYTPDGANRDGYAMRLVQATVRRTPEARNLLFVLTDGKPFDQRIQLNAHAHQHFLQYQGDLAVEDTAREVRSLRQGGIDVFGLFTGDEADVAAAQIIYGNSFAHLTGVSRFAERIGRVLQNEIVEG
ncbi:MAG: hypothetical protein PUJ57_02020 [Peptoniphilaceae bacterium]|nr:hypothetical protein [Peptoniphilaceae bacterium]